LRPSALVLCHAARRIYLAKCRRTIIAVCVVVNLLRTKHLLV